MSSDPKNKIFFENLIKSQKSLKNLIDQIQDMPIRYAIIFIYYLENISQINNPKTIKMREHPLGFASLGDPEILKPEPRISEIITIINSQIKDLNYYYKRFYYQISDYKINLNKIKYDFHLNRELLSKINSTLFKHKYSQHLKSIVI